MFKHILSSLASFCKAPETKTIQIPVKQMGVKGSKWHIIVRRGLPLPSKSALEPRTGPIPGFALDHGYILVKPKKQQTQPIVMG